MASLLNFGRTEPAPGRHFFPKRLLTDPEMKFYQQLRQAVPEYVVLPQVCMGALIDPAPHLFGPVRERARYRYQSKMVDFTIWDPDTNQVHCLVEHDDPTHDKRKQQDRERDAMAAEAGYPTVRVDVRRLPDLNALREAVLNARVTQGAFEAPSAHASTASPTNNGYRGRRQQPASVGDVLRNLGIIAVLGVVGYFALTTIMARMVHNITETNAQRLAAIAKRAPTPATPTAMPFARPMAPAPAPVVPTYQISWQPCMVYGDAQAIAQRLAQGCAYREVVAFRPVITPEQMQHWYGLNLSRVLPLPGCPAYAQWAQELMADPTYALPEKFARLDTLFNDAIVKGCMAGVH